MHWRCRSYRFSFCRTTTISSATTPSSASRQAPLFFLFFFSRSLVGAGCGGAAGRGGERRVATGSKGRGGSCPLRRMGPTGEQSGGFFPLPPFLFFFLVQAVPVRSCRVGEVEEPRLGESHPAAVTAGERKRRKKKKRELTVVVTEVVYSLHHFRGAMRTEWVSRRSVFFFSSSAPCRDRRECGRARLFGWWRWPTPRRRARRS